MFKYIVQKSVTVRPLLLYKFLVRCYVYWFLKNLEIRYNLIFVPSISYIHKYSPEVYLVDENNTTDRMYPQLTFKIYYNAEGEKVLFIKMLRIPEVARRNGIGTYCVEWIKKLSALCGCEYIFLGSYSETEKFWEKMGFIRYEDR